VTPDREPIAVDRFGKVKALFAMFALAGIAFGWYLHHLEQSDPRIHLLSFTLVLHRDDRYAVWSATKLLDDGRLSALFVLTLIGGPIYLAAWLLQMLLSAWSRWRNNSPIERRGFPLYPPDSEEQPPKN
jgi:hypothetical protein